MARYPVVTADEFRRFVTAKWSSLACECCGNSDWEIGQTLSGQLGALLMSKEDGTYSVPGSPAGEMLAVLCLNCGNVRLIHRKFVADWLERDGSG